LRVPFLVKKPFNLAFWIMPVLVYATVFGFAELITLAGNCYGWWENCWSRQDSGLYLEISRIGHTLFPCGPENGYEPGSDKWCGNAGWAPFYPFLIFVLHSVTGLASPICGILWTHAFFIGFLYVVARIIQIQEFSVSNTLTLLLCGIFPGGIYFFSIFPMALMVLLLSLVFWALTTQNYKVAALPSVLVAWSYSSSIIIFFSFGVYLIYVFFKNRNQRQLRFFWSEIQGQWHEKTEFRAIMLFVLLPGSFGLLTLYTYDYVVTGSWNAMYMVQNKYGHLLYSPFKHLGNHWQNLQEHWNTPMAWVDFHNIFFFFAIPVLVYLLTKTKHKLTPLLVIFTLILWYIPFSISIKVSLYRGISLLAPVMAFLHPVSNTIKIAIMLVFGVFYYFMGVLYVLSLLM